MSFQAAINKADSQRGKANLTNDQLLQLYAHFKQGSIGSNDTPQPNIFDLKGRAKWQAWTNLGSMSQAQAQQRYVQLVNQFFP